LIEATDVTKRYGSTVAVQDLTFTVKPGIVMRWRRRPTT